MLLLQGLLHGRFRAHNEAVEKSAFEAPGLAKKQFFTAQPSVRPTSSLAPPPRLFNPPRLPFFADLENSLLSGACPAISMDLVHIVDNREEAPLDVRLGVPSEREPIQPQHVA